MSSKKDSRLAAFLRIDDNFVSCRCIADGVFREYKKYSPLSKEDKPGVNTGGSSDEAASDIAADSYFPAAGEGYMIKTDPKEPYDPYRETFRRSLDRVAEAVTEICQEVFYPKDVAGIMIAVLDVIPIKDPLERDRAYEKSLAMYHSDKRAHAYYERTHSDLDKTRGSFHIQRYV